MASIKTGLAFFLVALPVLARGAEPQFTTAPGFEPLVPSLDNGDGNRAVLPAAFFRGTPIRLGDDRLMMIYASSGSSFRDGIELRAAVSADGGQTWEDDRQMERNPDPAVQPGRPTALIDRDGTIHVFYFGFVRYTKEPETSQSDMWTVHSSDGGETWVGRRKIWSGYTGMTEPAIQTRSGRLLVPLGYLLEPGRFAGCVVRSDDAGRTWQFTDGIELPAEADAPARAQVLNGGALEPTLIELSDGRILMLIRTLTGRFWQAYSADDGATWSAPAAGPLGCGGTGTLYRVRDGRLLFLHNPPDPSQTAARGYPHGFGSQALSFSSDDGATWGPPHEFIRAPRTVHSLAVETEPGKLLMTAPEWGRLLVHGLEDNPDTRDHSR